MKKKSFNYLLRVIFFKEQDPFHLVVAFFFIIFLELLFFFQYLHSMIMKNTTKKLKKAINKDYKINLHNLEDISFRFIPSPHLFIKKADFKN